MGAKKKKLVYPGLKPSCIIATVTYTGKRTVSQERVKKKEVAAFICYADSAGRWNKKCSDPIHNFCGRSKDIFFLDTDKSLICSCPGF